MNDNVEFQYQETIVTPVYGGKKIEAIYMMIHTKNGRINKYRVTCEIRGIQSRDLHMFADSAEFVGNMEYESNDETLTEQGAINLFNEHNK